jgi:hypothetical protein
MHAKFWCGNLKKTGQAGKPRRRGEKSIKKDMKEIDEMMWSGLISLRVGISDGLL